MMKLLLWIGHNKSLSFLLAMELIAFLLATYLFILIIMRQ